MTKNARIEDLERKVDRLTESNKELMKDRIAWNNRLIDLAVAVKNVQDLVILMYNEEEDHE
jgi:hypothetical protein